MPNSKQASALAEFLTPEAMLTPESPVHSS